MPLIVEELKGGEDFSILISWSKRSVRCAGECPSALRATLTKHTHYSLKIVSHAHLRFCRYLSKQFAISTLGIVL